MSEIGNEKERLNRDATYLGWYAKGVSKDRTYYLGEPSGDFPTPSSDGYVSAQKIHNARGPMYARTQHSYDKAREFSGIISEVLFQNDGDHGLQEEGEQRRQDLGNKFAEANTHLTEAIAPHLAAALELMGGLERDLEELVGFMELSETGFRTRAQELREEADRL